MQKRLLLTAEVASSQQTDVNSNVSRELESAEEGTMLHIAPSAIDKLRRFCYLGRIKQPVYAPTTFDLTVEAHFEALRELCGKVNENELIECLRDVLDASNDQYLPRHDEAILVLAVYLSTCPDEKHRTLVRGYFAALVRTSQELFLFVKFVKQVQKLLDRKTPFSRTVRKAVLEWYQHQALDKLLHMWSLGDCNSAQHRELLQRCHYMSAKFDADKMAALRVVSAPSKDLINWPDYLEPLAQCKETIQGIANLRLTPNAEAALPLIEKMSLSYEHLPRRLVSDQKVVNLLMAKMTYDQMLQSWPTFLKLNRSNRHAQTCFTQRFFDPSELRAANVEPLRLLLQEARGFSRKKVITKGVVSPRPSSIIQKLYKQSFGFNKPLGLRLHITINLEMVYLRKYLLGRFRSIKYIDAVLAIAFGYFKCDPKVTVRIWYDKTGKLKALPWTPAMSVDEAKATCESQKVVKIKQTLIDVIDDALQDTEQTYDVFLVLVPCGTRGNQRNKSEQLCKRLDEYREKRNKDAKFIILSLRQQHGSMGYSSERNENILELCSISEQTPRLINAFAHGKFF
ncbi:uncharacterized protein LOC6584392 isoform X2 [Drosophila mojavensis]|uniref:uncharacterized protein LOC6584392 isoform X2 n=1 Tax=Drosophila mojavensis TaxID=7230 RepID=UPI0013EE9DEE|nr:uncharacterized protein LOC6584392 isoform X2 [Drosophila mojavensis]